MYVYVCMCVNGPMSLSVNNDHHYDNRITIKPYNNNNTTYFSRLGAIVSNTHMRNRNINHHNVLDLGC